MLPRGRVLTMFLAGLLLSGCKIALVAVEGGDISSASGQYFCPSGSNCLVEVNDRSFRETFIAEPHEGWAFSHWLNADNSFCGNSTEPTCQTRVSILPDVPQVDAILASSEVYYLIPVFVALEAPPETPGLSAELQARYDDNCARCHDTGNFGAPVIHDQAAWEPRLARGIDALLTSVKNGRGAMPPNGGCSACSDADLVALIEYMSGPASQGGDPT